MKKDIVEEVIHRKIEQNKEQFSKEELTIIKNHMEIIKKIYVMGIISGRAIYEE